MISVGKAAEVLGVSVPTLHRWEKEGRLIPDARTPGGQRRYDESRLHRLAGEQTAATDDVGAVTIAYARVSSQDQKSDLERQKSHLTALCVARGWSFEVISDLGSGMNYRKKGLRHLLERLVQGNVDRLVLTHKDRLLRFGAELVFAICEMKGTEVVIINRNEEASFEEDLTQDVLEIITVFSARLYGARSRKNRDLIDGIQASVKQANGADHD